MMDSTLKTLMVDCMVMAAQNNMHREAETIFHVLPLLISDIQDRHLCEALYYILMQDASGFSASNMMLPTELQDKLVHFLL